jgi:hypothetical protein
VSGTAKNPFRVPSPEYENLALEKAQNKKKMRVETFAKKKSVEIGEKIKYRPL